MLLQNKFLKTANSCKNRMLDIGVVELDRIAHDIHSMLQPKADPPKKYSSKVNSVVFKYFIIPHLRECGGEWTNSNNSVLHFINFTDSESFASVFQSLGQLGVLNPMEKTWPDGSHKFIVVSAKFPTVFRFSETMGTLLLKFHSQGFTQGGLPINDLFEGKK